MDDDTAEGELRMFCRNLGSARKGSGTRRAFRARHQRLRARGISRLLCGPSLILATATVAAVGNASVGAASASVPVATAAGSQCPGVSGPRNPSNPLGLATNPGVDPLHGAQFFVDGPSHGAAAGQIARLLGIDANVPVGHYLSAFQDNVSWQSFLTGTVDKKLPTVSKTNQTDIHLLEKIASEPEAQRISTASSDKGFAPGTPGGIGAFTNKLFCGNFTADPGTVPIISTYLMHPVLGGCATTAQIQKYMPLFEQRVNAIVSATGDHAVVYLLELDAVGSSACMAQHGSLPAWETMLKYEVDHFATLPHAVVYVEGGYSDSNTPQYAAKMLNTVDINKIEGFFTNDTHLQWTSNEIKYGETISHLTHGARFIINTADNGQGPKLNPHPTTQGVEDNCNPPGRGLGPQPTTDTGVANIDAYLWTHIPGNSGGSCNGGPPPGGFFPAFAIGLASRANGKLGPGSPSKPY
jgi:endoglucanase